MHPIEVDVAVVGAGHVLVLPPGDDVGSWSGAVLRSAEVRRPQLVRPDGYVAWTGRRWPATGAAG